MIILGSNGLLGQKLVRLFHDKKLDFLAASLSANRINSITGFNFKQLDISNKQKLSDIVSAYKPSVIINAAGMTNVDDCDKKKQDCLQVNVEAVKNMVEIANNLKTHLIQVSTDFVFSGDNGPYTEDDIPNPVNFYGQTKLDAENYVIKNCNKWSIVRTVLVYGITELMTRSNIVLWVKKSLEEGKAIRVVNDQYRTPTLAEDLALGCYLIAKNGKEGIFHISGNEMMSIYDIAIKVAEFFKLDKNLISQVSSSELNEKAKRPPKTGFIIKKAEQELGFKPRSFLEGLKILSSF